MKSITIFLIVLTALAFYISACNVENAEGQKLAKRYCQSCHQLPQPGLLDKKTWFNYVLPKMGSFLGFSRFDNGAYFESGRVPEAMSIADWNNIVKYYVSEAPDSLTRPEVKDIRNGMPNFAPFIPASALQMPVTTYTGIQPDRGEIWFGDGLAKKIYQLGADGNPIDSFEVGIGVANVHVEKESAYVLSMGVLQPSDEKRGDLSVGTLTGKAFLKLLDTLQRPVYADYADLNKDGLNDIVVCEFGNTTGCLSWFENKGNNQFAKHALRSLPGAIHTQIADLNKDGLLDVVALMAQGDEGIFIYYNKGNNLFTEERVLQLPPAYGSNYFELADFNKDGYADIVATNGDNGDYPPVLKPYHGIRIYLNDGHNQFKEKRFLPMNGASKVLARDFDGDGDLDIAAISFFPDFQQSPEESFLYWESSGNVEFTPYSPDEAKAGRWLTMDAGDIDKDGDLDIVLGNALMIIGEIPKEEKEKLKAKANSLLILKNLKNR